MPRISITTTTTTEVKVEPKLKAKLMKELREYQVLYQQMKELEGRIDRKKAAIGALRDETGELSLQVGEFRTTLVLGESTKLDKKKLIALGCAPAWIEEATTRKPKKAYEKITLPGDKDREEDE